MESQKYVQQMQQETIRQIELTPPKNLISVAMDDSWLHRAGSDPLILLGQESTPIRIMR
jgi:hypothetical protein